MIKKNIFLFIFVAASLTSLAQSVDLLTGRLQMSIPLGQLQANDVSIPISVYHHGGTLKVAEGDDDCGLGWSLAANNFSVSRIVRGLPDEINTTDKKGWLYNNSAQSVQSFTPVADDNLSDCSDETADWNYLDGQFKTYANDSEPDLFYVNAPDLSAQFVFGADGAPKLLTHQDIEITVNGDLTSFVVKTNNGMVYTFALREVTTRKTFAPFAPGTSAPDTSNLTTAYRYYRGKLTQLVTTYTSRWRLTTMASSASGTSALFIYNNPSPEETLIPSGAGKIYFAADSASFLHDIYYRFELESVSLKTYTATFDWKNKLVQKVTISEATTLDKREFQFEYDPRFAHNSYGVGKSFLKRIRIVGGTCLPNETFEFDYQNLPTTNKLPAHIDLKRYWGQDHFGYPNGDAANDNLPKLYAYYNESDGRRLRNTFVSGIGVPEIKPGKIRAPNGSYSFGALIKVTDPMGGRTEIQYESNTYMDNSISEEFEGGGMRVKKLISQGGEIAFGKDINTSNSYRAIIKEYEYKQAGNNFSSGLLLSPLKLGYITQSGIRQTVDNMGDEPETMYTRVTEKVSGQGKTVYEFNIPGVFPETINGEWKATRSRIARKPGGSCIPHGNVKNGYYTFPYPPSSNSHKRGQTSKVTQYAEDGTPIREQIYTYSPRTNNPTTIKGLRFEKIGDIYHYGIYEILTGRMEVISQEVTKEASHEDATKWFQTTTTYGYNANHMLETVVSTLPDNTITTKRFKYAKDFPFTAPPASDTAAVAIKGLNDSNRGSELIEQITKVTLPGSVETVGSQLVLYRNFGGNRILPYYIKTLPQGASLTEVSMSGQNFIADTDYRLIKTLKEYDNESRILTAVDDKRNYVAHHYAVDPSLPLATFYNARAQEAAYEGFEMTASFGLAASGTGFQYPAGWTGSKAATFTNSTDVLLSSATNLVKKNGNKYRVSCWVYAPQNKTITFNAKVSGSTVSTVSLVNTVNNKWNYLEGTLNVTGVSNAFVLEVVTNASISEPVTVDDIICMPELARVSLQTILPFRGVTSATDDRGNSVKNVYDPMGRLTSTADRNRNLVQKNEYAIKNTQLPQTPSGFTSSVDQYIMNSPVTFTPQNAASCLAGTTYAWEVDGVPQASGPGNILNYTFTSPGRHTVKLTTTSPWNVSVPSILEVCVEYQLTGSFSVSITDQNGNPIDAFDCSNVPQINYTLVPPAGLPPDCTLSVIWTTSSQSVGGGNISHIYTASYTVNCATFKDCTFANTPNYNGQASNSITQLFNPNCQ